MQTKELGLFLLGTTMLVATPVMAAAPYYGLHNAIGDQQPLTNEKASYTMKAGQLESIPDGITVKNKSNNITFTINPSATDRINANIESTGATEVASGNTLVVNKVGANSPSTGAPISSWKNTSGNSRVIQVLDGATLTVSDSNFTNTTYKPDNADGPDEDVLPDHDGGAVILGKEGSTVKLTNTNVVGNTTEAKFYANGGAVTIEKGSSVTVANSSFLNNTAATKDDKTIPSGITPEASGGAIHTQGKTKISGTAFTTNTAKDGGAIYLGKTVTADGTNPVSSGNTYTSNTAKAYGGAIFNEGNASSKGDKYITNSAVTSGGAIYNSETGTLTVENGTFSKNHAYQGGAVTSEGTYNSTGSTYSGNHTDAGNGNSVGGAIFNFAGTLKSTNDTFTGNTAVTNGGAIYNKDKIATVSGDIFTGNTAKDGGAIYNNAGTVTSTADHYTNNSVDWLGGAIYSKAGETTVKNSEFKGNEAYQGGAVVSRVDDDTKKTDSYISMGNTYSGNKALLTDYAKDVQKREDGSSAGGAILNQGGKVTSTNDTFTGNMATGGRGGAVFNTQPMYSDSTDVDNTIDFYGTTTFKNNSAKSGGAIYNSEGTLTLHGAGIKFEGNTADEGSAIFNATRGTVVIDGARDTIDLDYDPYTTTTAPTSKTRMFADNEDIANYGTLNITDSKLQLHQGINNIKKSKSGTVNLANKSRVDIGFGTIYADKVTVDGTSTLQTHVFVSDHKDGDKNGGVKANTITAQTGSQLSMIIEPESYKGLASGAVRTFTVLDGNTVKDNFKLATNNIYTITKVSDGVYQIKIDDPTPECNPETGEFCPPVCDPETGENCECDPVTGENCPNPPNPPKPDPKPDPKPVPPCPDCDVNETNTHTGWWQDMPTDSDNEQAKAVINELNTILQTGTVEEYRQALDGLAPDVSPLIQAHSTEIMKRLGDVIRKHQYVAMDRTGYIHRNKRFYKFPRRESNLWVDGMVGKSKYEVRKGWDMDTKGIAVGLDGHVSEATKMGVAYAYTMADGTSVGRDTEIKSHTGMIYGEYNPNRFYANWMGMYTRSAYDEDKKVGSQRIKASYDVDVLGAQLMVGKKLGPWVSGDWSSGVLSPEIGARYVYTKQGGYTDTAGQKVSSADGQTLTGIIGAQYTIGYTLSPTLAWYPELRAALTYDIVEPDTKNNVTLVNGTKYHVTTENMDRLGIEVGARIGFDINRKAEIGLEYDGLFKGDYTNHTGMANLKYKF